MANLFNEIPGLVGVWNATQGVELNPETSKVSGWEPSETGAGYGALEMVSTSESNYTLEDALVDAMPGVRTDISKSDRLQCIFSPAFDIQNTGYTAAVLYKQTVTQTNTNLRYIYNIRANAEANSANLAIDDVGSKVKAWDNNDDTGYLGPNLQDDPRVFAVTVGPTNFDGQYYEDGVLVPGGPTNSRPENGGNIDQIDILNGSAGSSSPDAAVALFVLYDRVLNTQELADLHTLIDVWKTTAAPPVTYVPPQFTAHPQTPVAAAVGGEITLTASATGDPAPTFEWVAAPTNDPANYQDVSTFFSGTVTENTAGDTTTLTVDGLQEAESGNIRAVATNAGGSANSLASELTVQAIYPTSERFGPVRANDTGANYQWQLQAPGDTGNWQDVPVAGYDITPDFVGDDQYLDVNSATSEQDGTLVRCRATTPYNPTGVFTNVNTLNVVEA